MEKSESIKELAAALCKFQGSVEKIKKESENPFFKSKYASLSNILDVIREPLSENGLSFVQMPIEEYKLTTILMHTSGEWISGTYVMKPVKPDPQGMGSAITYQRRYALGAILGLNIDTDDDGNEASKVKEPSVVGINDRLKLAVKEMQKSTSADEVKQAWSKWKEFQAIDDFINTKNEMKTKLNIQ